METQGLKRASRYSESLKPSQHIVYNVYFCYEQQMKPDNRVWHSYFNTTTIYSTLVSYFVAFFFHIQVYMHVYISLLKYVILQ